MATGGIVVSEKHIECTVCFEVYRNPHALPCLHTFCKECINQLGKDGKVECPHCREVCTINQVRKDFKTQALIDSHNAKQKEVPGQAGSLCGMCGEQGSMVVSYCSSCDNVMCAKCHGIHAKLKATKSHPVQSLNELLVKAKSPYIDAIKILKCTKNDYDISSENIASTLSLIKHDKEDKIRQVDQHIVEIRANIHKIINTVYAKANDILKENKVSTDKNSKNIETKINFVMEIIENNDLSTFKTMKSQLQAITDEAHNMSKRKFTDLTSPVTFQLRDVHPETLVDVNVAEAILNPKSIQSPHVTALDFHKIINQKYNQIGSVKTEEPVHRMRMINDQLYCAAAVGNIHVYDADLTLTRTITSDKLNRVKSVTKCDQTGDLIVACGGSVGHGLHQLTLEGDYVTCITSFGEFSDVCCHSRKVYALEYEQCKIRVFSKRTDNVWSETVSEQIQLRYSNGSHFDKMVVKKDSAFVSSWRNSCVYVYSLSSRQRLRQLGRSGRSEPGELIGPMICDVDPQGCIMVSDWGNKRVQVCEGGRGGEEKWRCLTLPGLGGGAVDDVVGRDGHTLWVAAHNPHEIIKYKM